VQVVSGASRGLSGSNSVFSTITSTGGGGGAGNLQHPANGGGGGGGGDPTQQGLLVLEPLIKVLLEGLRLQH
jgi:hypothetical protein